MDKCIKYSNLRNYLLFQTRIVIRGHEILFRGHEIKQMKK